MKSFRRYILIIILVFLIPTLYLTYYEVDSLRENEKVIEKIYTNQLEAILHPINQYSDDAVKIWANMIQKCMYQDTTVQDSCLQQSISRLSTPCQVFIYDRKTNSLNHLGSKGEKKADVSQIKDLLIKNDSLLDEMANNYIDWGWQKVETLPLSSSLSCLVLFTEVGGKQPFIVFALDPKYFIDNELVPYIQQVSNNEKNLVISIQKTGQKSEFTSGERTQAAMRPEYERSLWLFPEYSMGIKLQDSTISELVHSRARKNMIMIIIIDFILLLGIWLIYRNVKKQLELSQLKSDFVSNVSHEIRTPLALISMYIETLEMGRVNSRKKIHEYYKVILQETHRLATIVNKILSFSQIENGKRKYVKETVRLNEIVGTVIDSYSIRLEQDGFAVDQHLQDDIPDILADREAITDALVNLIDNAMKYSDEHKHITIETRQQGSGVILSITDQGIGISLAEQKYVFDKFYRVTEKNLALRSKGSGLGLPIVKHIMDAHNGKITIESSKGKGSTFHLHFPIQNA